jgi:hypothetical protein
MACHIWTLGDGLFLDDHVIRRNLLASGWSWHDLTESSTLEIPGPRDTVWWQTAPWQWRNARPVAMGFSKLAWLVAGDHAWLVHASSVAWHGLCAVLVYALAWTLYRGRGLAVGAGCIFAMNPHSPFPVSWISAQNGLICTAFVLISVLCYLQATDNISTRPLRTGWLVAGLPAWGVALFSKEIAIVLPFLLVGLDLAFGGWRTVIRRGWIHLIAVGVLIAFMVWRLMIFPTQDPPIMYYHRPGGFEGVLWYLAKLVHQLLAVTVFTPLVGGPITPDGRPINWGLVALMGILPTAILFWYGWSWPKGRPGRWYWPMFVVMGLVPVLPVFARPDLTYLPFVGYAVIISVILARPRGRARVILTGVIVAATLWSFGIYRVAWAGICRTEQLLISDAVESPPPDAVTDLLFIDLPVADAYVGVALRKAWNRTDPATHVLTLAPHPLRMVQSSTIIQLDAHRFRVKIEQGGYFSGAIGRMFLRAMRPESTDGDWHDGLTIKGERFDATVIGDGSGGTRGFEFTFHLPLDDARLMFFRSTSERPAGPVRFRSAAGPFPWTVPLPDPTAPDQAAWRSRHAAALTASRRLFGLLEVVQSIIRSEVYLTGGEATD